MKAPCSETETPLRVPMQGNSFSFRSPSLRECFQDFFIYVKEKLEEDELLSKDIDEHMLEINDYVMLRMHRV